jgi:hypothetical protein
MAETLVSREDPTSKSVFFSFSALCLWFITSVSGPHYVIGILVLLVNIALENNLEGNDLGLS